MSCLLCERNVALINAHIIPKCIFSAVKQGNQHAVILKPGNSKFTETTQSGFSDRKILCKDCDGKIGSLDDYANKIFGKKPDESTIIIDLNGGRLGYHLPFIELDKIKRFMLSILYRASISSVDFFSNISLGPYEEKIKNILNSNDPLPEDDWEIVVIRYNDAPFHEVIYPSYSFKLDNGIRVYAVNIPHYKIIIKVDKRKLNGALKRLSLKQGVGNKCLLFPYANSSEDRHMKSLIEQVHTLHLS